MTFVVIWHYINKKLIGHQPWLQQGNLAYRSINRCFSATQCSFTLPRNLARDELRKIVNFKVTGNWNETGAQNGFKLLIQHIEGILSWV